MQLFILSDTLLSSWHFQKWGIWFLLHSVLRNLTSLLALGSPYLCSTQGSLVFSLVYGPLALVLWIYRTARRILIEVPCHCSGIQKQLYSSNSDIQCISNNQKHHLTKNCNGMSVFIEHYRDAPSTPFWFVYEYPYFLVVLANTN